MESVRLLRLTSRVWLHKFALVFLTIVFLTLIFKALKSSKQTASQNVSNERYDGEKDDEDEHGLAEATSSENYGVCQQPNEVGNMFQEWSKTNQTPLIIITPTYERSEQTAELTRLSQTLQLLIWAQMPLIWIIAHDSRVCHENVRALIDRKLGSNPFGNRFDEAQKNYNRPLVGTRLPVTILSAPMPSAFRDPERVRRFGLPRGVAGRRAALSWLIKHTRANDPGVIYFADDDNVYDLEVFEEISKTHRLSMFPVGLLQPSGVRGPIVDVHGRVIGFLGGRRPFRMFPVDMAGFAFSLALLHQKRPLMPFRATMEEEGFLRALGVDYGGIEPLANNCTRILVWHTMTAAPQVNSFQIPNPSGYSDTNLPLLAQNMVEQGLIKAAKGWFSHDIPTCLGQTCYT
ncbi:galactosylgalactosylxylosylprotein 3-beta-glucuronosyltransferase S-like [Tigriopus californicus]|uniref:galactosylgalactosylxylosylprotein 3-beta-glucuronosyltransferase S-like n=1 Tax=Tigriopus californicus TaxID=6832 RepID=UPI0027DA3EC6|nr:galactosylgalactosylxylosylprotein 3-beta-glucuronosyltransferase S-like [Tigriopus californicus]